MKSPSVTKLLLLGAPHEQGAHVYLSAYGNLTTGALQGFPGGAFVIVVSQEIKEPEEYHSSLKRIVRNTLSAYPIVDVVDGGNLPFDLRAWLREHRQAL
jgi:hypothetical protein